MLYILGTIVILTYILFRWRFRKFIKVSKQLKHDLLSLPLVGIAYLFFGSGEDRMKALKTIGREAMKQGGIISGWLALRFFVVVADAEMAEFIFKNCHEKDDLMGCMRFMVGNSNLASQAPIHGRRKVMSPVFSSKYMSQYVSVFAEQSRILVEILRSTVGKPVPVFQHITNYAMDSLCQTTLGFNFDVQRGSGHPFITAMLLGAESVTKRMMQPWLHNDFIYNLLPSSKSVLKHKTFGFDFIGKIITTLREKIINQEKEGLMQTNKRLKSFIELLMEASAGEKGYSDLMLKEETLTLLLAGTDTTAVNISFMALLLARYPDIQTKVYQELVDIYDNGDRLVQSDDLSHLKYMDAVIKECLRLYPAAPVILRKTDKDITLPSGVFLPKGCGLLMHLWAINRNPRYWGPDAEEFRPERFLNSSPKHPAQFLSFSQGPRNCIGSKYAIMSTKTALATLLRNYRLLPAPESTPDKPIRTQIEIVMKEVNNYRIILEPRC